LNAALVDKSIGVVELTVGIDASGGYVIPTLASQQVIIVTRNSGINHIIE
jgi:hypothetical protein